MKKVTKPPLPNVSPAKLRIQGEDGYRPEISEAAHALKMPKQEYIAEFKELKGAIGSPRLGRENGIRARHKRRFKTTADSKHALPLTPGQMWVADIAHI